MKHKPDMLEPGIKMPAAFGITAAIARKKRTRKNT